MRDDVMNIKSTLQKNYATKPAVIIQNSATISAEE
jgi:hypothetical protein